MNFQVYIKVLLFWIRTELQPTNQPQQSQFAKNMEPNFKSAARI